MNVKYQVFVSSTFVDLKEARHNVIQTVMQMDCIPSGMELFPAIDEEQFNFIKKIIDDCDYYILILAGKYGTVAQDGLSYTEKEYNYAISKGIKVLAFVLESLDGLPADRIESDPVISDKLLAFRTEICSGRIVKMWKTIDDLPGQVALSLSKTIKTYPAQGWVRGGFTPSSEVLIELEKLKRKNLELSDNIKMLQSQLLPKFENMAGLEESINIKFSYDYSYGNKSFFEAPVKWGEIFYAISPFLTQYQNEENVNGILAKFLVEKNGRYYTGKLPAQLFQTIKYQFVALGLIKVDTLQTKSDTMAQFMILTELGKQKMFEARIIRKE